jgi:transcriptional regulator with XRE-family HTH domain
VRRSQSAQAAAFVWVYSSAKEKCDIELGRSNVIIGDRLRALREEKKLSQGDIEKRTGLLRCYTSRVENGHTVPAIETLEKMARALEVLLYQLFYDGQEPPELPHLRKRKTADEIGLLISMAQRMVRQKNNRA